MKKIWILVFICACSSSSDIIGSYKTVNDNIIDINLTLEPNKKYWITYKASMVSDSVFGDYEIKQNKIHLYSKSKMLNLESKKRKKEAESGEINLTFKPTKMSFAPNLYDSKLIINDSDTLQLYSDFEAKTIKVKCSDHLTYLSDGNTVDFKIPDCDFDYDINIYNRDERTIIPDLLIIDLPLKSQIDILNNKLKKRKEISGYD